MDTAAPADGLLEGRWRIGEVIGRGAAADVHAATDAATGRPVAVKVIRAADADAARRFEREVAVLEGVDHPGIVAVLGHGTCPDGRPYVVMERALGGTLHGALLDGALGATAAAALGAELASALDHAHQRGVVHRDVKPANVLLDGEGRAKLGDFGIARLVGAGTLTATGWAMGTPAYLAPEQVRGERVGPPADVYALGLVVLEAATGERAYPGDGVAAALARLEHPVAIPATLPAPLAATLSAMTAAEPADRPTAAETAARLGAVDEAGATTAMPIAGLATAAMPIAAAARAPVPGPAATRPRRTAGRGLVVPTAGRRALLAAACFAAGFLAVLFLRSAFANDGDTRPVVNTETSTTTIVTTTTAAPTTTTAPPEDDDEGRGNGNGNGRGHDDD